MRTDCGSGQLTFQSFDGRKVVAAIHADGVNFIEIAQRIVFPGEVADFPDRRNVAIHRINGLERYDLRRVQLVFLKHALQMLGIVVTPDALWAAALAHAFEHGSMVLLIRENDRALQELDLRRKRGFVRNIAKH
jgi:hypothetical protein